MKQEHTPLYDALKRFADEKPVSFHVPGHKNGQVFLDKGNDYFGQILKLDGTELEGLDDLHEPEGVIKEAEELLSALYGSQQSFFLVNGSTVGNLAMVLGTCKAGDTVLVQRNCHKSIMNALELARVKPVFLSPRYNDEWGTAEEVEFTTVQSALDTYVDAKALILTYPTYYGIGEDVTETIRLAHEYDVQVLVDEAHGAHFIAGEPFMKSSLAMGADYVVQSAHKTLPAMTMGSYLHIGQNCRFPHNIKEYLQILQSSSPSYPIMASLDLARSFLGTLTKEDLDYTKSCIEAFKKELSALEGIKLLQPARGSADLLKAVLQSDGTYSGFTLQEELRKEHIYTELADIRNVLLVLPILKAGQDYPFEQMVLACKKAVRRSKTQESIQSGKVIVDEDAKVSTLALTYDEMASRKERSLPFAESAGFIAAETIIPYPPGIPFIIKGERLSESKLKQLQELVEAGTHFHGFKDEAQKKIAVYDKI